MAKKQREHRLRPETLANLLVPVYEEKLEESLGIRLRDLRRQQSLSLRALAEKSGLSANTLSLIENGKTSPSVSTLQQIALALSIPITSFFEMRINRDPVIYTQKKNRASSGFPNGFLEDLGTGNGAEGIQSFVVSFNPHSESGPQSMNHEGVEFIYCLNGKVIYTVLGEEYPLEPGDTLMFSSKTPHTWRNPLAEVTQVMIILASSEEKRRPVQVYFPV